MLVNVCIATFKRPELLRELLISLEKQVLNPSNDLAIIVIDNDRDGSGKSVVNEFATNGKYPIIYDLEPIQNISLARNRAISHVQGKFFVFVDDDEFVEADWLDRMLTTSDAFNADVVFGPVKPLLPDSAHDWITKGHFFDREMMPTGTPRPHGAANNALVKTEVLRGSNMKLDPAFGLTGGEDTELFARLQKQGAKLIWCDEAIVYERVPQKRMTVGWLVRRSFRGGQTVTRIFFAKMTVNEKLIWSIKRLVGLGYFLLLPCAWIFGKHHWVHVAMKASGNLGQLTGLSRFHFREYSA